jgi:hypothetical protein
MRLAAKESVLPIGSREEELGNNRMNQVCMSCMAISMSLSVSRVIDANIVDAYLLPAWPACAAIINWRPLPPTQSVAKAPGRDKVPFARFFFFVLAFAFLCYYRHYR